MRRSFAAFLLLLLAACSTRTAAPPALAAVPDAGPAAVVADAGRPSPPKASKEARRAYRQHLLAGRKLAAAKKWGEAVVEFEAALVAIPEDGRGLSELGWAAFNAGDLDKARRVSTQAIAATPERQLKAQLLYNLGRVEEASGHTLQAARRYGDSLALRRNETVLARLAGLGNAAQDAPRDAGLCATPRALDEVCACVIDHLRKVEEWEGDKARRVCTIADDEVVPGVRFVDANSADGWGDASRKMLVARQPAGGWSVITTLVDLDGGGFGGVTMWQEDAKIERASLGGRQLLKVTTGAGWGDADMGLGEHSSGSTSYLTVCVLGDASAQPPTVTRCPLERIPTSDHYSREIEGEPVGDMVLPHTPGLPIHRSTEVRVDLDADGTARVILVKGSKEDVEAPEKLGTFRLW